MLPIPESSNFSRVLKAKRLALGITRTELANQAGVNLNSIRRYEEPTAKDHCRPNVTSWKAICDALTYFVSTLPNIDQEKLLNIQLDLIPEERLLKDATIDELIETLQFKIKDIRNEKAN